MQAENVIKHIVNWMSAYATNANMKGFVVGVSGGIDSAVTSILCAETGLEVLCIEMPIHQDEKQVTRAQEHIKQLKARFPNVKNVKVDLTPVFENFKAKAPIKSTESLELSLANTRARLRMTSLYYYAGAYHYLVAGTGNKVEDFGIGFFTKHGDGGVDLSPIADLLKSEVYKIGDFLKISESILKAAPTDGLFGDNRNDEDQIGASYDELEWAMEMTKNNKTASDFEGRLLEVFNIYTRLNKNNKHKIIPIPVCKIPDNLKKK
ncbi:MAG: NAD(+) synthase [Flavobacteriaceae bacterium]|nr:NAD(+) synthase [Flavobacteriaceae bacterium]